MSTPREPRPGVLVLSILSARWAEFWPDLLDELTRKLGPLASDSGPIPFTVTTYYEPEFGRPLTRRILSFERPLPLDGLADVKRFTNTLELASRVVRSSSTRRIRCAGRAGFRLGASATWGFAVSGAGAKKLNPAASATFRRN